MDSESDDEFEGDLNNEDDDGCNNCGNLMDKENSFDVRIKRYDEALTIIKEENQHLWKELETRKR